MGNILLTGGHGATTGIAIIETIKKNKPDANIYWIGSATAVSGSRATTLEHKIYPSMGVKYYSINAGKLQTKFTRYTLPLLLLIPVGFIQAFFLVHRIRPHVILSFGGYSSFPVVLSGWILGIPIIVHEQTIVAGRASVMSAFFADKVALSREESLQYFPKDKCVVTGNPMRSEILSIKPKYKLGASRTILVMGGSRGSEFINEELYKILPKLISKYNVIHITGERDYEKYSRLTLNNYRVLAFVNPKDMVEIYNVSDIIISRSGANSISEILSIKRPSLLIPLPRTFMNEQYKNAKFAEDFGIAKVMVESDVDSKNLMAAIKSLFLDWQTIVSRVIKKPVPDILASNKVFDLISKYI